ncbi:MAG TPA: alpha/beta hydrolase [Gemmatimonadales bacterium]|nr:alpha/beta hydrolase [Gemmatimonadales bacterium]
MIRGAAGPRAAGPRAWLVRLLGVALLLVTADRVHRSTPRHVAERLRAGDVHVRAVRAGRGDTTVVLIHGYGESLLSFRSIFDRLAARYRVVALDLPGFGLSDKPEGPYDFPTMAWRLRDFLGRWTDGPVAVVGHSMGGQLAAALALAEPVRVVATVLIAPAGHGIAPLAQRLAAPVREALGWVDLVSGYLLPLHDAAWLREPDDWADYSPGADPGYRRAAVAVLEQFDFAALRDRYAELRQPTLIVWGRLDPTIPVAVGERLASLVPCNRFVVLEHTLHRPHQALPDTVAAEVEAFIADPRSSAPACCPRCRGGAPRGARGPASWR